MEILHEDDKNKRGEFYIESGGKRVARLQYRHQGADRIDVYHTEVSDELSGQGIAKKLVAEVVKYARAHELKLGASCPFAAGVIDKTPEYHDVLATS